MSDGGQTGVRRLRRRGSDGSKWLGLSGSVCFGRPFRMFFHFFSSHGGSLNAKTGDFCRYRRQNAKAGHNRLKAGQHAFKCQRASVRNSCVLPQPILNRLGRLAAIFCGEIVFRFSATSCLLTDPEMLAGEGRNDKGANDKGNPKKMTHEMRELIWSTVAGGGCYGGRIHATRDCKGAEIGFGAGNFGG